MSKKINEKTISFRYKNSNQKKFLLKIFTKEKKWLQYAVLPSFIQKGSSFDFQCYITTTYLLLNIKHISKHMTLEHEKQTNQKKKLIKLTSGETVNIEPDCTYDWCEVWKPLFVRDENWPKFDSNKQNLPQWRVFVLTKNTLIKCDIITAPLLYNLTIYRSAQKTTTDKGTICQNLYAWLRYYFS